VHAEELAAVRDLVEVIAATATLDMVQENDS